MLILTKPVFEIYDTLTLTFIWPLPSDGHALHMTLTFRWPWPSDCHDLQMTLTFRLLWPSDDLALFLFKTIFRLEEMKSIMRIFQDTLSSDVQIVSLPVSIKYIPQRQATPKMNIGTARGQPRTARSPENRYNDDHEKNIRN